MLEMCKFFISIYCLKDPYHRGHSFRVNSISMLLGRRLGLDESIMDVLHYASLLHDIGKAVIPALVLQKSTELSETEWEFIRIHPIVGYELLCVFDEQVAEAVRYHHENWNGTGYPEGLSGEGIPLISRIIRIADSLDAAVSKRPYRAAKPLEQAREEIRQGAGLLYDPELVRVLVSPGDLFCYRRGMEKCHETQKTQM